MTSKATSLQLTCKATLRRFGRLAVRATPRIGASASWSKDVFIMIFCSILWLVSLCVFRYEDGDQESSGEQVGLGLSEGDLQEVWLGLGSN